jgi:catechol 2,3-dioxygenase-like lactoylglutathione lyase family enzyme
MVKPGALEIDHIAYPVSDVPATLQFYRDVLGLPLVRAFSGDDWGGHPWLMMIFALGDGRQLALSALRGVKVPTDQVLPPDLRHISLTVENEQQLAAWRDRLAAHDVPHWEEDHGEQTSLYFTDPSNVILEVTTPASRTALPPDPHAADVVAAWLADKD